MKITVIAVGKIKEKFYRDAIDEYGKRLLKYCRLEILEVADEKVPDNLSPKASEQILKKEYERISKLLKPEMEVFALAIEGESLTSPGLAKLMEAEALNGHSHLTFIIGGSLGLHPEILSSCQRKISFSAMTFPHQLMRVILLEQIYRGYRIIHHEPYHK